ncbi:MAG: type II secretion system F family protein [Acidobacteriota bacterium]
MLIVWLTFIGIAALILAAYWLVVVVPERREQTLLKRRLKGGEPTVARQGPSLLKEPDQLSGIPIFNTLLARSGYLTGRLQSTLDQSGLRLNLGQFLLISAVGGVAAYLAASIYVRVWWLSLAVLVGASLIPLFVVRNFGARRVRQFEEQFPEAIDLIARSMRAGHALSTGLKMAADELPPPAGIEFRKLYERQNYGAQLSESLRAFADAVPSLDARFFVTAVLTQRETGGNLAEVLDRLAAVMRERFRIRRDVRVRSAHGRITAYILAGMPPLLAVFLMMSSPAQFRVLLTDPLGIRMLEGAVLLQVTGVLIVRKLVDIEY